MSTYSWWNELRSQLDQKRDRVLLEGKVIPHNQIALDEGVSENVADELGMKSLCVLQHFHLQSLLFCFNVSDSICVRHKRLRFKNAVISTVQVHTQ